MEFILVLEGVNFILCCHVIIQFRTLLLVFYLGGIYDGYFIQYPPYYWLSTVLLFFRCYIIRILWALSWAFCFDIHAMGIPFIILYIIGIHLIFFILLAFIYRVKLILMV